MRDGWAAIDQIGSGPAPDRDEPSDQELIDKLYLDVFHNPAGYRLMNYWRSAYLEKPVLEPGRDASAGYIREGENGLIREIQRRIQRGMLPK